MDLTRRTALAIRHVGFEHLGSFAPEIARAGYEIDYADVGMDDLDDIDPLGPDLLIILGGPLGVYETAQYPVLETEIALLRQRLAADRPTLGICLGAQLMAVALDADVGPMGHKEIGWGPVTLSAAGQSGPLRHLDGKALLHWHGDMFAIPQHCTALGSTDLCANQAFSRGPNILALQFHAEATQIEPWLIGHACELGIAGIDPVLLRSAAEGAIADMDAAAAAMMREWLAGISP